MDEVDVEAVDLGHELGQCVQPGFDPPEVVVITPVVHELLHCHQLHALRWVQDGLSLGQARGLYTPTKVVDRFFGQTGPERPDGRFARRNIGSDCHGSFLAWLSIGLLAQKVDRSPLQDHCKTQAPSAPSRALPIVPTAVGLNLAIACRWFRSWSWARRAI